MKNDFYADMMEERRFYQNKLKEITRLSSQLIAAKRVIRMARQVAKYCTEPCSDLYFRNPKETLAEYDKQMSKEDE